MDVALRGPSARVAREYQAWRAGKTAPVVPGKAAEAAGAGKPGDPAAKKAATEIPDPRSMPEDVARRLLGRAAAGTACTPSSTPARASGTA